MRILPIPSQGLSRGDPFSLLVSKGKADQAFVNVTACTQIDPNPYKSLHNIPLLILLENWAIPCSRELSPSGRPEEMLATTISIKQCRAIRFSGDFHVREHFSFGLYYLLAITGVHECLESTGKTECTDKRMSTTVSFDALGTGCQYWLAKQQGRYRKYGQKAMKLKVESIKSFTTLRIWSARIPRCHGSDRVWVSYGIVEKCIEGILCIDTYYYRIVYTAGLYWERASLKSRINTSPES